MNGGRETGICSGGRTAWTGCTGCTGCTGRGGGVLRGGAVTGTGLRAVSTGSRTVAPQPQVNSGCGHSSERPQEGQRMLSQESAQERKRTCTGMPPRSSGILSAAPQGHGNTGGW
jgi:hypothetical protein